MTVEAPSGSLAHERVLAREIGELLIELAIALQKYAIYPSGHPALTRVSARVHERMVLLLEQRASLSLGVARTQLVIEGIATDAAHPVLRQLALRFHDHHLAALRFERGLTELELSELLLSLARETASGRADPLGLGTTVPPWPHIRLSTLSLGDLGIVEGTEGGGSAASRLWLDLARAALAGGREESEADAADPSPAVVARAIDRRSGSGTYDQVIAGYLIEITRSLRTGGAAEEPLVQRVRRLVRELSPDTLRRLMAHGGDARQQRVFLESAAEGLPVDTVVHLLCATADAAGRPLSEPLLRIYEKLSRSAGAEAEPSAVPDGADAELRSQVRALLTGWELPNPNPEGYERALGALAGMPAHQGGAALAQVDPERVVRMCLEVEAAVRPLETAVDRLVAEGRAGELLDLLDAADGSPALSAARARLARPENLPQLIGALGAAPERLVPLVERMGEPGLEALLDALLASTETGLRRRIFDLLVALGPVVGPAVDARLAGESRWYALRNLLALLDAVDVQPERDLRPFAAHEDSRVRREALKLLLKDPAERDGTVLMILGDADPRVLQLIRSAAGATLPGDALELWKERVADPALPEPLRASLVPLVAGLRGAAVRDALLGLAVRGRTLLGRPRLEPATPIGLAALQALATRWSADDRVAALLHHARAARDPAIRSAAGGEA